MPSNDIETLQREVASLRQAVNGMNFESDDAGFVTIEQFERRLDALDDRLDTFNTRLTQIENAQ